MSVNKFVLSLICILVISGCGKSEVADDVARIREIKEQEQAEKAAETQSNNEFAKGVRNGAAAPLREIK